MSDSCHKRLFLIVLPVLAILVGTLYLVAMPLPHVAPPGPRMAAPDGSRGGSQSSTQPKITWSPTGTEIVVSPGESTSKDFTFVSSQNLSNAILEAVPEIAGFLTIQPNTFASVPAGQPQSVHVTFSIASGTALGPYDGTIHLRVESTTFPATMKVVLNVWNGVQLNFGHLVIPVPPNWAVNVSDNQLNALTPALQDLIETQDAEVPPADFIVRVFPKSPAVSITDYGSQFSQGWYAAYAKTSTDLTGDFCTR